MTSYLDRYRNGEYEQVWQELLALGEQVHSEPYHSDALMVARETMRRVLHNIQLVHAKLRNIGYRFQFPERAISPPRQARLADIEEFEREVGRVPLSLRAWAEVVGSVNFMGTYARLSYCETEPSPFAGAQFAIGGQGGQTQVTDLASLLSGISGQGSPPPEDDDPLSAIRGAFAALLGPNPAGREKKPDHPADHPSADESAEFQELREIMQESQSSMRESFWKAADPNHKENEQGIPPEDRVLSDPLVVELQGLSVEDYESWQELEDEDIPFTITISPDVCEKANRSGDLSYVVELPDAVADGLVRNTQGGDILFVEYLRSSFEWAGFRELQNYDRRDEALLKLLREGLQPF